MNGMQKSRKPPLTPEERAEKERLKAVFEREKPRWQAANKEKLTQDKLGDLVGQLMNGEPITQGAIWQYLSPSHNTKLNPDFVQAFCIVLGVDIKEIGERFLPLWIKEETATYGAADVKILTIAKKLNAADKDKLADYAYLLLLSEGAQ